MPRRGFLPGLAEFLRFGFGVADQAQTSTPLLSDESQIVLPYDVLRAGNWFTMTWTPGVTPAAGDEPVLIITGGRTGTYIVGVQNDTTSSVTSTAIAFDPNRTAVEDRFAGGTNTLAFAVLTGTRQVERGRPTTVFELASIIQADSLTFGLDGVGAFEHGGTLQMFPFLTHTLPIYIAPGSCMLFDRPGAAVAMLIGFIMVEP